MVKKKKSNQKSETIAVEPESQKSFLGSLSSQAKIGESYTSLILGIIVVVVSTILVVTVIKNRTATQAPAPVQETSSASTEKPLEQVKAEDLPTTYTVVEGDDLWTISEKVYKSGYNWVDIATANKLENPDVVEVGTKLTLPKVEVKTAQAEGGSEVAMTQPSNNATSEMSNTNAISGNSYTVVEGDILSEISVRAYNDEYKWTDIATANKLENPDLIEVGQKLTIPR